MISNSKYNIKVSSIDNIVDTIIRIFIHFYQNNNKEK